MEHVVEPGTGVRHRFVFELRYDQGELYWDRCGRIARTLAAKEGWALQSVDVNGCHIWNDEQNLIFAYSPRKLDLTQSQSQDVSKLLSPGDFAVIAEEFSETVVGALDVKCFPRIGFRAWTLYGTESLEDASIRIGKMSFFSPCKSLNDLGEILHLSHTVVITRLKHTVRIAATPFEQQVHIPPSVEEALRQKSHKHPKDQKKVLVRQWKARKAVKAYPTVGIMIDLDAYIEDVPYPKEISVRTFIEGATEDFNVICSAILSEELHQ
jgi:hypothetical protein